MPMTLLRHNCHYATGSYAPTAYFLGVESFLATRA